MADHYKGNWTRFVKCVTIISNLPLDNSLCPSSSHSCSPNMAVFSVVYDTIPIVRQIPKQRKEILVLLTYADCR